MKPIYDFLMSDAYVLNNAQIIAIVLAGMLAVFQKHSVFFTIKEWHESRKDTTYMLEDLCYSTKYGRKWNEYAQWVVDYRNNRKVASEMKNGHAYISEHGWDIGLFRDGTMYSFDGRPYGGAPYENTYWFDTKEIFSKEKWLKMWSADSSSESFDF